MRRYIQAQQRLWALEEEQQHSSALHRVRQEVAQSAAMEDAEEKKRTSEWAVADEEVAVRRGHEATRRARLAAGAYTRSHFSST